jgi:polysaccharide biosynthesis/export protein
MTKRSLLRTGLILLSWSLANPGFGQQATTAPTHPAYLLQIGDEVAIRVFHNPELDQVVRIRPDGNISAQLVNDIPAEGITPTALAAVLARKYSEFYQAPKVSAIVMSFANQKVFVGGEVAQPGAIPLIGRMTALSAVIQAGGFRPSARSDQLLLIRNDGNGNRSVHSIDLKHIKENAEGDFPLQAFDMLYVPQSRISKADQFVDRYVRQLLPGTLSGGFSYLAGHSVAVVQP